MRESERAGRETLESEKRSEKYRIVIDPFLVYPDPIPAVDARNMTMNSLTFSNSVLKK